MYSRDAAQWTDLILERRALPAPLDDAAFRQWMSGRPIFVSSVMDAEMQGDRDTVRAVISAWGGVPVMWEAITPQDQRPENAYLAGVDASALFVLLLGSRYGVPDSSGYSPTHKEANRAKERGLYRLLFVRADVDDAARDGKLNDWLRGLYNETAGARYRSTDELRALVEARLREMAARQEALWLKLGRVVFPGDVAEHHVGADTTYTITARVRDTVVRRTLTALPRGKMGGAGLRADRLTWGSETRGITVVAVESDTRRASEAAMVITARHSGDRAGNAGGLGGYTFVSNGRSFGPSDRAALWIASVVFGAPRPQEHGTSWGLSSHMPPVEGLSLPEVLQLYRAEGWLAEGLTRLFVVEQLNTTFGGYFDRLDVGPATAAGIPVSGEFMPEGASGAVPLEGIVPLA